MWAQLASTGLGLWLMAAPALLGYGDPAGTSDRIVGPIVASFAWIAVSEITRPLRRVSFLAGGWLLLAPWVLGYDLVPSVNSMVLGLLVIVCARVHGTVSERFGGGWASLWSRGGPRHEPRPPG